MSYVSYTCLLSVYTGMCVSVFLSVFSAVLANKRVHIVENVTCPKRYVLPPPSSLCCCLMSVGILSHQKNKKEGYA